jgi:hypothetical protein
MSRTFLLSRWRTVKRGPWLAVQHNFGFHDREGPSHSNRVRDARNQLGSADSAAAVFTVRVDNYSYDSRRCHPLSARALPAASNRRQRSAGSSPYRSDQSLRIAPQ